MNTNFDQNKGQINRLTEILFVVHAWMNLPILGADGPLFHLDTRALDVDGESAYEANGEKHIAGLLFLKRLRLLPVTPTQRGEINNDTGFSISNVFLGQVETDGQTGIGSNMSGAMKSNVKLDWVYPGQKVMDMSHTFGRYGLVHVPHLKANTEAEYEACQRIFDTVMSGMPADMILEDMPEYFGGESLYLLDKAPVRFKKTAEQVIEESDLSDGEKQLARNIVPVLLQMVQGAHMAALDPEAAGILPQSRDAREKGQKSGYDKCDRWLMSQFPSYPMDTELEKSNSQLIRAIEATAGGSEPVRNLESIEDLEDRLEAERVRNNELERRLNAIEAASAATAGAAQE